VQDATFALFRVGEVRGGYGGKVQRYDESKDMAGETKDMAGK